MTQPKPFQRLLLTGAAGGLGRVLRPRLREWTKVLRVSDRADCGPAAPGEEVMPTDPADKKAVNALVADVEVVLHFGGISLEVPFEQIVQGNIVGLYNVDEAVHKHHVRRVVYASSSHVVGFYPQSQSLDTDVPLRPDCLYGVSKCFGEALTRYYFDGFGIEAVCLRIGSSFAEPKNPRMLVSYSRTCFRRRVRLRTPTAPPIASRAGRGYCPAPSRTSTYRKMGCAAR